MNDYWFLTEVQMQTIPVNFILQFYPVATICDKSSQVLTSHHSRRPSCKMSRQLSTKSLPVCVCEDANMWWTTVRNRHFSSPLQFGYMLYRVGGTQSHQTLSHHKTHVENSGNTKSRGIMWQKLLCCCNRMELRMESKNVKTWALGL